MMEDEYYDITLRDEREIAILFGKIISIAIILQEWKISITILII